MNTYSQLIEIGVQVLGAMGYTATGQVITYAPINVPILSFSVEPALPRQHESDVVLALQHILRCVDDRLDIQSSDMSEKTNQVLLDINGHLIQKFTEVEQKTKMLSDRAVAFRTNIRMDPLSPLERKIVHSIVDTMPGLSTESFGAGYDRHVVIKWNVSE